MDTGEVDVLSRHPVPRHRLTVNDYHRLGEAGILTRLPQSPEKALVRRRAGGLHGRHPHGPRRLPKSSAEQSRARRTLTRLGRDGCWRPSS